MKHLILGFPLWWQKEQRHNSGRISTCRFLTNYYLDSVSFCLRRQQNTVYGEND